MGQEQAPEAIIVAECGAAATRAILVEVVEDAWRFVARGVAPSTLEPPHADLRIGLGDALAALEDATGRRLAAGGRPLVPQEGAGDGAAAFVATVAAAPPPRVVFLALGGGALLEELLDAGRRAPVTVLPLLTLDEDGHIDDETRATVATLGHLQPDLLLLVAGPDAGAGLRRLLGVAGEIVATASIHEGYRLPAILFVGDERWHGDVGAAFSHGYEIGLVPLDDLEPAALAAIVEQEVLDLADRRASETIPGFDGLAAMSAAAPLARSRALDLATRFMAAHLAREVLTVDLDEGATFCWARGADARGLTEPALDLALGAANLLTTLRLADVARWLPFTLAEDELTDWILNRALRPFTLPVARQDRLIEAAIARELLRTGVVELDAAGGPLAPDLIAGGGFFARWPDPATAMLVLVDGLQPRSASGLVRIALDRDGLLPAIGALRQIEPRRAAELFAHDGLLDLGAYVAVDARPGDEIHVRLERANGETRAVAVAAGSLALLPLPEGERAALLQIEPGEGSRVGRGAPGMPARFTGDAAPRGGLVGLIVDARGHPLDLPRDERERIARLAAWSEALRR